LNVRIQKHNRDARLSNFVVAVAGLVFASDPALAAFLATSPGPTLNTNVRVVKRVITMDGSHMATEVVLAREGASTGWMRARVGLGPVGIMGFLVGLEIKSPSEG
jgi:hypothetical protein